MPSDKDGFVSYKSHFKALEHLSDELLGQLFRAVYHYQISGTEPAKDSPIYFPFAFMKLSFDADDLKYQAVIERNKANGAKGGRRANNPDEPKEPSGFSGNPEEPKKADKDKDKDKGSSNEDEKASAAGQGQKQEPKSLTPAQHAVRVAAENDEPVFTADNWPGLTNPTTFAGICADLRLPLDLNREAYRATIQDKMRTKGVTGPARTLRSWIGSYFLTEQSKGPLATMTAGLPHEPTPQAEYDRLNKAGGVIAIRGDHDQVMTRQLVASYQKAYPQATIHAIRP